MGQASLRTNAAVEGIGNNIAIGVAVGIAIGAGIGAAMTQGRRKADE